MTPINLNIGIICTFSEKHDHQCETKKKHNQWKEATKEKNNKENSENKTSDTVTESLEICR